jgi:GH25 family lysozyme M1 (1,4-beta-N-acetylmuramidase)
VPKPHLCARPEPRLPGAGTSSFTRPRVALLRAAAAVALAATMTATGVSAASAKVIGPDVSSHNHDSGTSLNWKAIHRAGGASFAFIKATEGGGYRNPHFSSDFASARGHGLIRGAYHYARPGGGNHREITNNAKAEATQFGQAIGDLSGPGNLAPVLDLEDAGNLNPPQLSLWVTTWLTGMTKLTGRTPIIYTGVKFWQDSMANSGAYAAYPLWLAAYGVSRPARIGGWGSYTFWQYTESGQLAGAGLSTDLSVFNGSLAQLQAMTSTNAVTRAAAAAAAAASAAALQRASEAAAEAAADARTLRLITRDATTTTTTTTDEKRGDTTSPSPTRPSWLGGVYGMAASLAITGS